ncbi:MAG: hypothetical protein ABIG29_00425 [Candidatus Nealsonbacteria bacterium]
MLGVHGRLSEGTAEGWFGKGKTSAITSVAIIAMLSLGIVFLAYVAIGSMGGSNINQPNAPAAPAAPTPIAPTPVQAPPAVTNKPAQGGMIVLTVEELLSQVIATPNRYKEGTAMQITGLALNYHVGQVEDYLWLGPEIQGFHVDIRVADGKLSTQLLKRFSVGEKNFPITIQGTLRWVSEKEVLIEHASMVADAK